MEKHVSVPNLKASINTTYLELEENKDIEVKNAILDIIKDNKLNNNLYE